MKFRLHLDLVDSDHVKNWKCGGDIEFDPGSISRPFSSRKDLPSSFLGYRIKEQTLVSANLMVPAEWVEEEFVLQAGMDPDSCIRFSRESYNNGEMLGIDKGRPDILYGTMGPTLLSLIRVRTGTPLLVININVEPDPSRVTVMRGVVDELTNIAPHTLSSLSEWQNACVFSDERRVGSASYAAPYVEFKAISGLIAKLFPILLAISFSPAYRVVKERRRIPISRAKKLPKASVRKISPCFIKGGTLTDLPGMVDAYVRVRSCDITAHRVIAAFLATLRIRLDRIFILASAQIEGYSHEINACEEMCNQVPQEQMRKSFYNDFKYNIESLRKHKQSAEDVLPQIKKEIARLNSIRKLSVFRNAILRIESQISSQDFAYDERYQRCLSLMVDYENGHHWWIPLEDGHGWTHSLELLGKNCYGNSLQRKYSVLFEYWCCFRLLHAFEKSGFDFSESREEIRSQLARSIVVESDEESFAPLGMLRDNAGVVLYEVRIIHNYSAYSSTINPTARFKTTIGIRYNSKGHVNHREKLYETPDMAVIIRNKQTGNWFWVTIDAKSTDSLRLGQVYKQNNYLNQMHTPEFDPECEYRPLASWLIYAGRLDGVAGLENVLDEDISFRNWQPEDMLDIDRVQSGNSGIKCSAQDGIKLKNKSDNRFMGQIRANPMTAPLRNSKGFDGSSPFCDFAKIIIATARNTLG